MSNCGDHVLDFKSIKYDPRKQTNLAWYRAVSHSHFAEVEECEEEKDELAIEKRMILCLLVTL